MMRPPTWSERLQLGLVSATGLGPGSSSVKNNSELEDKASRDGPWWKISEDFLCLFRYRLHLVMLCQGSLLAGQCMGIRIRPLCLQLSQISVQPILILRGLNLPKPLQTI